MKRTYCLLLIFCFSLAHTQEVNPVYKRSHKLEEYNYEYNFYVTPDVWETVKPYFLPSNHPIKPALDKIFKNQRVTSDNDTVLAAGFPKCQPRPTSHIVVLKHPTIKNYLIKAYLDDDTHQIIDYQRWIKRIEGAKLTKAAIESHGYDKMFKVPSKWIYPLPAEPSPPEGSNRKNFVLIVEDMEIHKKRDNYKAWKGNRFSKNRATAIYRILQEVGLCDNGNPVNLPFCHDGKQAFVDTEHYHQWPIPFELTLNFLSPKMAEFWKELMKNGGKKNKSH